MRLARKRLTSSTIAFRSTARYQRATASGTTEAFGSRRARPAAHERVRVMAPVMVEGLETIEMDELRNRCEPADA